MNAGFEEYVAARGNALVRFAYLLCGDRHLAEDLVQDVLIRAHRHWPRIEASNPDAYLNRAVVRANISWWRKVKRREVTADFTPDSPSADFADDLTTRDELMSALAGLPARQRAVLVLRYFEDFSDERIAETVGCSPATVRVHVHRGLGRLRGLMVGHTEEVSASASMIEEVRQGAARADRRHRTVIAAVVVALVLAAAAAIPLVFARSSPPPIQPAPSPSVSLTLVPAALNMPAFPYTPTILAPPQGRTKVQFTSDENTLTYDYNGEHTEVVVVDSLGRYVEQFTEPVVHKDDPVTVNGVPGVIRRVTTAAGAFKSRELRYQRDGRWVIVTSTLNDPELIRFAEGLEAIPIQARMPWKIGLAPQGYDIVHINSSQVCIGRGTSPTICLSEVALPTPYGSPSHVVQGRPAFVLTYPGGLHLQVLLGDDGTALDVMTGAGMDLALLLEFAEAVEIPQK